MFELIIFNMIKLINTPDKFLSLVSVKIIQKNQKNKFLQFLIHYIIKKYDINEKKLSKN